MNKKINVIDLDKTLIPFDSFRKFIIEEIKKGNVKFCFYTGLKVLKLISLEKYKHYIIKILDDKFNDSDFEPFVNDTISLIDSEVLSIIKNNSDEDTILILLSASPHSYVKLIAEKLGWQGAGSYIDKEDKFHHIYASKKVQWVRDNYDEKHFIYNMTISDSDTDKELLELFGKGIQWQ